MHRASEKKISKDFFADIKFSSFAQLLASTNPTKDKIIEGFIKFCIQILRTLQEQVHDNNHIHRDIKLENLLIAKNTETNEYEIYFIDFGISKFKNTPDKLPHLINEDNKKKIGTVGYIAPELLAASAEDLAKSISNEKSDLYSLSISLREAINSIDASILKPESYNEATPEENKLIYEIVKEEQEIKKLSAEAEKEITKKRINNAKDLQLKKDSEPFDRELIDIDMKDKLYRAIKQEELNNALKDRQQNNSTDSGKALTVKSSESESLSPSTLNHNEDSTSPSFARFAHRI